MKNLFFTLCFLVINVITASAQEIFDAVRSGNLTKVKELIEKDTQLLNARNPNQSTPLHIAVDVSNMEIVQYLIEKGADVNSLNGIKQTPLFFAKKSEIAKILIDKGANVNHKNYNYLSVLMWVSTLEVSRILVENGSDIDYIDPRSGATALFFALRLKRYEIADYLLDKGAKITNPSSIIGFSELKYAMQAGSIKYLNKFLQLGYDMKIENEGSTNLIHYAAESNSVELIQRLIGLGLPVNVMNLYGWSPLHIAAYKNNGAVFKALLEKGLDKNSRTENGKSPYNLAKEVNSKEIMDILISMKADTSGTVFPKLKGEYLGQKKPGVKPEPFASGIVAAQYNFHSSIVFSPDGNEAYWSEIGPYVIYSSKNVNGIWTEPAKFSNGDVPFVSPKGNKFYFINTKETETGPRQVIYVRDKTTSGWSEPYEISEKVNSLVGIHFQMSVDNNENLYFGVFREGRYSIYFSKHKDGEYSEPATIDELKDMKLYSPYISPDGSYLLATEFEETSLNIFFRDKDGSWGNRINLSDYLKLDGPGWRSAACFVTANGKYLFFKKWHNKSVPYWFDASFIEDLRKEALKDDK